MQLSAPFGANEPSGRFRTIGWGGAMARYLIIGARNHADTYSYLQRQFAGDDTVQVLLDRRYGERRRRQACYNVQRRRRERRHGPGRESDLARHGFLVVRQAVGLQWRPPWWRPGSPGKYGDSDRYVGARHMARLIVGAIALYHREKIVEAIKRDALFDALARELEEGRKYYEKNLDPSSAAGADYFAQAIVDILVKEHGDVESKIW
jgi:hypothetical protein